MEEGAICVSIFSSCWKTGKSIKTVITFHLTGQSAQVFPIIYSAQNNKYFPDLICEEQTACSSPLLIKYISLTKMHKYFIELICLSIYLEKLLDILRKSNLESNSISNIYLWLNLEDS